MRPHLSLDVRNVPDSVEFYQKVFGVAPQKQTPDYAKFDLTAPALNLALVSSTGMVSAVNHLGIEVESANDIAMWRQRLQEQGILEKIEEVVACCFARQDKLWFTDPDGNPWEVFTAHEQLAVEGLLAQPGCCVPKGRGASAPATCTASGRSSTVWK
jgi:catechol 2,3-dioxygenase-like lactoylglutathione lyase family enzyme